MSFLLVAAVGASATDAWFGPFDAETGPGWIALCVASILSVWPVMVDVWMKRLDPTRVGSYAYAFVPAFGLAAFFWPMVGMEWIGYGLAGFAAALTAWTFLRYRQFEVPVVASVSGLATGLVALIASAIGSMPFGVVAAYAVFGALMYANLQAMRLHVFGEGQLHSSDR